MGYDAFRQSVQQQVRDNWTTTPILYDASQAVPQNEDWIRITMIDADSFQASIGGGSGGVKYRHPGAVVLEVFTSEREGSGKAMRYADTLAAVFRGQTVGGALFRSPTVRQIGAQEGWYRVHVICPFQRDECF